MFLSLGIMSGEFRYQIGFCLLELPLPAVRDTLHGPCQVPHKIDILVPVSALRGGLRSYQCPQNCFLKQVFPSPATCGPPETSNPEVGEFLEFRQLCSRQHLNHSINLDFLQQTAQLADVD